MFFNLFGKKKDSFDDKAANLVLIAKTAACTYYIPCANKFPLVFKIESRHWDPILTAANCSFAVMRLLNSERVDTAISHNRKMELFQLILMNLEEDQPNGAGAVDDCLKFVNKGIEDGRFNGAEYKQNPGLVMTDAFGIWSFWNLMGRVPGSAEEFGLARAIGNLVLGNFSQYWD